MSESLAPPVSPPGHEPGEKRALQGIALMICAVVIFACQDAITKHLAASYPVTFFLMIRYWAFAVFATLFALRAAGGSPAAAFSTRAPVQQIVRALSLAGSMILFAVGLRYMKLVEMHAVFGISPLIVAALSVPLLGERVGWRRWAAIMVGFCGLLVILRPGFGVFQTAAVFAVLAAASVSLYVVLTRRVSRHDDFPTTFLYTGIIGAAGMTAVGLFHWAEPTPADWLWIIGLCVTGISGHFLLIRALEYAPASLLQPFNYLTIVVAAALGFAIFAEVPDAWTVIGGAIVVASGLFVILRERAIGRS